MREPHVPGYWPTLALAALTTILGLLLAFNPLQGVVTLTLAAAAFLLASGIAGIILAFKVRGGSGRWYWLLIAGIADLAVAGVILAGWPGDVAWVLGLLVGVNLVYTGLALEFVAFDARSA